MNDFPEPVNLLDEMDLYAFGQWLDTMAVVDRGGVYGFPWLVEKPLDVQRAEELDDRIRAVRG